MAFGWRRCGFSPKTPNTTFESFPVPSHNPTMLLSTPLNLPGYQASDEEIFEGLPPAEQKAKIETWLTLLKAIEAAPTPEIKWQIARKISGEPAEDLSDTEKESQVDAFTDNVQWDVCKYLRVGFRSCALLCSYIRLTVLLNV